MAYASRICIQEIDKSNFENRFSTDTGILKNAIIRSKRRVEKLENNGHHDTCAVPMGPGVCPVAKGSCNWTGCRFRDSSSCIVANVESKKKTKLSTRAVHIRETAEQRFAEIIEGWKRQNENLEHEITAYRAEKCENKGKIEQKSTEITNLRRQNEKLESLLRKCETQINKVHIGVIIMNGNI